MEHVQREGNFKIRKTRGGKEAGKSGNVGQGGGKSETKSEPFEGWVY